MRIKFMFCSLLMFINWLQNHLIPCPFKYLTGIDCPGCGFQRSVIALLRGNLHESLHLYPATIPFLITCGFVIVSQCFRVDTSKHLVKRSLYIITGNVILIAYVAKLIF